MQQYAMTGAAVVLVGGVLAGGAYAWTHRTREVVLQTAEVEPNNDPTQANELPAGRAFSAYLGARRDSAHGDEDIFAFVVPQGANTVRLEVAGIPNIDMMVDVFLAGRSDPLITLDSMPRGGPENAPNLPLAAGRYLVRVREADNPGHYPIENVSDAYAIQWSVAEAQAGDEREWNDTLQQGERVALGDTKTGFIGWGGDVDSYCLETADAMHIALDAIPGLDLQLTTVIDGIDTLSNVAPRGEGESLDLGVVSAPRRVCIQVSAAQGVQRGDANARYTLHLTAPAPTPEPAPEAP